MARPERSHSTPPPEQDPAEAMIHAAASVLWRRARPWVVGAAAAAGIGGVGGVRGLVVGERSADAVEAVRHAGQASRPPTDAQLARDAQVAQLAATVGALSVTVGELRDDVKELGRDVKALVWRGRPGAMAAPAGP